MADIEAGWECPILSEEEEEEECAWEMMKSYGRYRSRLGASYIKWRGGGGGGGVCMEDDEVLCQSVEVVLRVAHNCPSLEFSFICILYPQFLWIIVCHHLTCLMTLGLQIEFQHSDMKLAPIPGSWRTFSVFLCHCPFQTCTLDTQMPFIIYFIPWAYPIPFDKYILFKYPQWVLPHWVLYSQYLMPLITHFIVLTYLMPFDNGVLLTSNAVYTEGVSSQYILFQISTVGSSSLDFVLLTSHAVVLYWSSSDLPQLAIWSFK